MAPRFSTALTGVLTPRASPPPTATRAASRRRLKSNEAAIEVILQAIEQAGYRSGKDVAIALDPAASEISTRIPASDGD